MRKEQMEKDFWGTTPSGEPVVKLGKYGPIAQMAILLMKQKNQSLQV